jgi:dUTP pyrophosphatase
MFAKISKEQWLKDLEKYTFYNHEYDKNEEYLNESYDAIQIPDRGSLFSAGYDFYIPYNYSLSSSKRDIILTGIRWDTTQKIEEKTFNDPLVLLLFARSSVAKECGFSLMNKVGVIDMDYCMADNEGHIMILVDRKTAKTDYTFKTGDRIVQGVITSFHIDENDHVRNSKRTGGFGSTGK